MSPAAFALSSIPKANRQYGFLITFEGCDGVGKTTQSHLLYKALIKAYPNQEIVQTYEPGGTVGADSIRTLLVEGKQDRWSVATECLLFTAARCDHYERKIEPALHRGAWIICDRFIDSTRVYQQQQRSKVDDLHKLFIGIEADLTVIIDMPIDESLGRKKAMPTQKHRFEFTQLQKQVKQGFLDLAKECPKRCYIINGARNKDDIARDIYALVDKKLPITR